jgi:two-component system sensor histidine kinase YesM
VQLLGAQIEMKSPVSENENAMEQIRGVSALLGDLMQEFIIAEIEGAEVTNENTRRSSFFLFVIEIAIGILAAVVAYFASVGISQTIRRPIHKMEELSTRIARGELSARAEMPHVEELDNLASNLNTMAKRIQELIDENILEQKNLKKAEMKTLQAQITPHFLYNTLDTIIWLAESEENDDVVEITKAFSNFFRISLSRGHEWITVSRELEHVSSYLTIQKIRYPNILTYEIISDEGLDEVPVLKLLLQPLVENAIYHGLKNKRGRGKIMVSVKRIDAFGMTGGGIRFTVEDNGLGFTPERLKEVLSEMSSSTEVESLQATYGLYNVNKRRELYYDKQVSLEIVSEYGMGTTVSFVVPVKAKVSEELDV